MSGRMQFLSKAPRWQLLIGVILVVPGSLLTLIFGVLGEGQRSHFVSAHGVSFFPAQSSPFPEAKLTIIRGDGLNSRPPNPRISRLSTSPLQSPRHKHSTQTQSPARHDPLRRGRNYRLPRHLQYFHLRHAILAPGDLRIHRFPTCDSVFDGSWRCSDGDGVEEVVCWERSWGCV